MRQRLPLAGAVGKEVTVENLFDELAKGLAAGLSRRECLLRLVRGLAGILLASLGLRAVVEPTVAEAADECGANFEAPWIACPKGGDTCGGGGAIGDGSRRRCAAGAGTCVKTDDTKTCGCHLFKRAKDADPWKHVADPDKIEKNDEAFHWHCCCVMKDPNALGVSYHSVPPGTVAITLGGSAVGNATNSTGATTPFVIPDFEDNPDSILGPLPGAQNAIASAAADVPPDPRTFCTQSALAPCTPPVVRVAGTTGTNEKSRAFCDDIDKSTGNLLKGADLGAGFVFSSVNGMSTLGEPYGSAAPGGIALPALWGSGKPVIGNGVLLGIATGATASGKIVLHGYCQNFQQLCAAAILDRNNPQTSTYQPVNQVGGDQTAGALVNNNDWMLFFGLDKTAKNPFVESWDLNTSAQAVLAPGIPLGVNDSNQFIFAPNFDAGLPISVGNLSDPNNFGIQNTGLVTCRPFELFGTPGAKISHDGTIEACLWGANGNLVPTIQTPEAEEISAEQAGNYVGILRGVLPLLQKEADLGSPAGRVAYVPMLHVTQAIRHLTPLTGQVMVSRRRTGHAIHLLRGARTMLKHKKLPLTAAPQVLDAVNQVGSALDRDPIDPGWQ
jgi:hypothetical protein